MSTDRRSIAPPFTSLGITWQCWIVDDGQTYVWRSSCGRMTVGKDVKVYWARIGDRLVGKLFPTIRTAMDAAAQAIARRAA